MGEDPGKKVTLSNKKIQLQCHLSTIAMGELGDIGWYVKLEALAEKQKANNKKDKDKERIRQPLF